MRKLLTVLLALIPFFIFPVLVTAKVIAEKEGLIEITRDEVINDDLFIGGKTILIDGTVNGDVFAGAETIKVNGTINGDLHAGGGNVIINGTVTEDVYVGAGNLTVTESEIGDSLVVGAGNVNIDNESSIGGSFIAGTGNMVVASSIARNLMAGTGTLDLNSQVGGEVSVAAGEINVGPEASIGKDFNYAVNEESQVRVSQTASIAGQTRRVENRFDSEPAEKAAEGALKGLDLTAKIISLLGALLVGYLLSRFAPKALTVPAGNLETSFLKSLTVGFLISVFIVPALLILALTGIGLPLAGILFLIFLISFYLSKFAAGLYFGQLIAVKMNWKGFSVFKALALGLIAIYILKLIPVIGFLVSLVVLWSGLGALFFYYRSLLTSKTKKK